MGLRLFGVVKLVEIISFYLETANLQANLGNGLINFIKIISFF